ncbi:MAG: hypothetical protein JO266_10280 [Acidobacteria bacterium]|nr:hypothetical protein [Alphaproteobacteria bacterium]MBV8892338.1 hypothetical protein [Acidobacteriota bacterium]
MNKPSSDHPDRRRHRREKTTIDHLVEHVFDSESLENHQQQPATTDSGASVEEQVRKEWDPKQSGGLPIF